MLLLRPMARVCPASETFLGQFQNDQRMPVRRSNYAHHVQWTRLLSTLSHVQQIFIFFYFRLWHVWANEYIFHVCSIRHGLKDILFIQFSSNCVCVSCVMQTEACGYDFCPTFCDVPHVKLILWLNNDQKRIAFCSRFAPILGRTLYFLLKDEQCAWEMAMAGWVYERRALKLNDRKSVNVLQWDRNWTDDMPKFTSHYTFMHCRRQSIVPVEAATR